MSILACDSQIPEDAYLGICEAQARQLKIISTFRLRHSTFLYVVTPS